MKHKGIVIGIFLIGWLSVGFGVERPPLNLTILLDLSDRILYPNQVAKDQQILDTLFAIFEKEVRNNLFVKSEDRFAIAIAKQKQNPVDLEEMTFILDLSKVPIQQKKTVFNEKKTNFSKTVKQLYEQSLHSKKKKDYAGADIWSFMKYEYSNYYQPNYRNVLVLLTDGYLYFESEVKRPAPMKNRYYSMSFLPSLRKQNFLEIMNKNDTGLQSVAVQYPDLNVILLEVHPKTELFIDEEALLQTVWNKWFQEMGAQRCKIVTKQPISIVKENIEKICK